MIPLKNKVDYLLGTDGNQVNEGWEKEFSLYTSKLYEIFLIMTMIKKFKTE